MKLQDYIFTADFESIVLLVTEDFICSSYSKIDFNKNKIVKVDNDDEEIVYKDGMKYFGSTKDEIPNGEGQVILPSGRVLNGIFKDGCLEGTVRDVDPQDSSITEVTYSSGVPHGTYRHRQTDGQLLSFGRYESGVKSGQHLVVGSGGNSYYLGHVGGDGKLTGEVTYLYPCLYKAIVGNYKGGRLTRGQYRTVIGAVVKDGFLDLKLEDKGRGEVKYDPSTFMRISRDPLVTDEYEDETVYVEQSMVEGAGEGLFARRKILGGELVSLFSGIKMFKDSNRRSIKYGDEEWSDFRYI